MAEKIYFVVSNIPEEVRHHLVSKEKNNFIEQLNFTDYSALWSGQEWVWIIQTFLHLKKTDLDIELVSHPVKDAICVTHFDTTKNKIWGADSFVVGIRSDTSPMRMKEFEIVQSPAVLSHKNSHFMCLWPQAHLIPRDPNRGNRIETISYFGGPGGLSPKFSDERFKESLGKLGVKLSLNFNTASWNDYRDTDLVIAVRNHHHPLLIKTKPASKLINTWQAGCVGLLGKEPAYRKIGRMGKDYFEVETPHDVLKVIEKLKSSPHIYDSVRQNGIKKYKDFSFIALQEQWVDLLMGSITDEFLQWQKCQGRNKLVRHSLRSWQSMHQWIDHKLFYLPIRLKERINKWGL